ncbi:MAG: cell division protein FtsQ/DivIB [Lachnospiraceae bacterium]|nr:cell division protein FtsQ/DivIB [Lachnospiraceae bacterium]
MSKLSLKGRVRLSLILLLAIAVIIGVAVLISNYHVDDIQVEGNAHYTYDDIVNMVMTNKLCENSVYLKLKYSNKSITDVPFIERMDVSIIDNKTVRITVYEKALAGCVKVLGQYLYFDRDGIVVESADYPTNGVVQVTGLNFDHVVMYQPLPVENDEIFTHILDITQMLNKYELGADKIYFDDYNNITLYFENVRVLLGNDNIEVKMMQLPNIIGQLDGKSGVLDLREFDALDSFIIFQED